MKLNPALISLFSILINLNAMASTQSVWEKVTECAGADAVLEKTIANSSHGMTSFDYRLTISDPLIVKLLSEDIELAGYSTPINNEEIVLNLPYATSDETKMADMERSPNDLAYTVIPNGADLEVVFNKTHNGSPTSKITSFYMGGCK